MERAYVLHSRPYRETSLLIEALTATQGRISLVARGAKSGKAKLSAVLQPFVPLTITWYGNGELVTLKMAEHGGAPINLLGAAAVCGLYLNELLIKLLPKWDPCGLSFAIYNQALIELETAAANQRQVILRKFEKKLITNLGYALPLTTDMVNGSAIGADKHYWYEPGVGLRQVRDTHIGAIKGSSILAFAADQYCTEAMADIKRLMRSVLAHYLGNKKIVTRELW